MIYLGVVERIGEIAMYKVINHRVIDVMTSDPVTVDQYATFAEVRAIFDEYNFNGLPIVDRDHCLIGLITQHDLLKAFGHMKRISTPHHDTIMDHQVLEIMTQKVEVFYPQTSLVEVLYKMIETKHNCFPVVDNGRIIGIVTREDMFRALADADTGQFPSDLILPQEEDLVDSARM
jgi:CBS domain-containing protein